MTYSTAVAPKGQIIIPLEVRQRMSLDVGSRVTLVYEDDRIVIMNPAKHAMEKISAAMEGEAKRVGLDTEEDITLLCHEIRAEVEGL